jgi:hypothetical protein
MNRPACERAAHPAGRIEGCLSRETRAYAKRRDRGDEAQRPRDR